MIFAGIALLLGCWAYSVLAILGALRYRKQSGERLQQSAKESFSGVSVLKPLAGIDEGLKENLRSYFEQAYPKFELLFAAGSNSEPANFVVRELERQFPGVSARLLATGDPPYPHDKVYKLQQMLNASSFDLIVMADSDIRVEPSFLETVVKEFATGELDLVTCPYRAVAGKSFWSKLEALGMNVDFHAGVFTALLLEGAKFAVGPTIVVRKPALMELGGMERVKDYLSSEDFMLGQLAAEAGMKVSFSSYVVDHRIGSESMRKNFAHRLRWGRTSRRSRPAGYIGQFFTYPVSACICIALAWPAWKPLLAVTILLRVLSAWTVSTLVLGAPVNWLLLPVSDVLTFAFWVTGFFGKTIHWRGRSYFLNRDGTVRNASSFKSPVL